MHVIAKAYGDEPLDRLVISRSVKLTYLLNPVSREAINPDENSGVGFPNECVFRFDSELFSELGEAWAAGDRKRLEHLWDQAEPLPNN
jgi:hypothetical protein